MSWTRFPHWLLPLTTPFEQSVFIALDTFGKRKYPSLATVAERANLDIKTVRSAVHRLDELGAIDIIPRMTRKGQTSNEYRLAVDAPFARGHAATADPSVTETPDSSVSVKLPATVPPALPSDGTPRPTVQREGSKINKSKTGRTTDVVLARPANPLYDAIVAECGLDYTAMTKAEKRACGVAASALAEIGVTAQDIPGAARLWRGTFDKATLTPSALARHWGQLHARQTTRPTNRGLDAVTRAAAARSGRS